MNKYMKNIFQNSKLYRKYSGSHKDINFYQKKEDFSSYSSPLTIYDGNTFHILCNHEFFKACLAHNPDVLYELENKLIAKNSIMMNLKNIIRVFTLSAFLVFPLGFIFRILIFEKSLVEQLSIANTIYGLLFIFLFGHLLKILIGHKYKENRYSYIFNYLTNETYVQRVKEYKEDIYNSYEPAFNPYRNTGIKNVLRITIVPVLIVALTVLFSNPVFGGSFRIIDDSLENNIDYYSSFFLPIAGETSYELTSTQDISSYNFSSLESCDDYYCEVFYESEDIKIYDTDFNLIFDIQLAYPDADSVYMEQVKDNHILLSLFYENDDNTFEYETVLYNLVTGQEVHRINLGYGVSGNFDLFQTKDFSINNNIYYFALEKIKYGYFDKLSTSGILIINGTTMEFHEIEGYYIKEIEYMDGELYYILEDEIEYGKLFIGKSDTTSFDLEVNEPIFYDIVNLAKIDNKMYFREHLTASELFEVDPSFNIKSIGVGSRTFSRFNTKSNTFIFGNNYEVFKEIDTLGTELNIGIICDECLNDYVVFNKVDDILIAIENNSILRTFEETNEPQKNFIGIPDTEGFYEYINLSQNTFYNGFMISYIVFVSLPFIRTISLLKKKHNNKIFFDSL